MGCDRESFSKTCSKLDDVEVQKVVGELGVLTSISTPNFIYDTNPR